jgi:gas vesicle protein
MAKNYQEAGQYVDNSLNVLAGVLVGAIAGAVTMLLLAPQSGEETRAQIQEKGIELRDRATDAVEDVVVQIRQDRRKLTREGRRKAKQLMHQGQEMVSHQMEHVSDAVQAGKKAMAG